MISTNDFFSCRVNRPANNTIYAKPDCGIVILDPNSIISNGIWFHLLENHFKCTYHQITQCWFGF